MRSVSKSQLKTHLLRICRELESSGEELIVTDRDTPVLKISPIRQRLSVEAAFADVAGKFEFREDPDAPTLEDWGDV